jgi:hypothetical protein
MFEFLNALSYDGTRGTVLQLEDLGDRFLMRVVYLKPVEKNAKEASGSSQANVTAWTGGSRAGTAVQLSP